MPIIDYKGGRQVEFGTGDILVSPGLLDMDKAVGVICLTADGTGVIGERTDYEPSRILEADQTPVRLTFENVESIDVLIRMLMETRGMMCVKMAMGQ